MKYLYLLLLVVCSQLSFAQQHSKSTPNLSLFFEDGTSVPFIETLNNGKAKVFVFWSAYCIPCKYEMRGITNLSENWYTDFDAEIYFVSLNNPSPVVYSKLKFIKDFNHQGQFLVFDPQRDIYDFLNGQASPTTVLFDKEGHLVQKWTGYDDGLERSIGMYFDKLYNKKLN